MTLWPRRWRWQGVLRVGVVVTVLVLSAALIHLVSPRQAKLILVLIPGLGVAVVFLRRPAWGLLALIGGSLLVPFSLGTGTQTGINITILTLVLLLGLWLLDMIVLRRRLRLTLSRVVVASLAILVSATLAFLAGQLPWFQVPSAPMSAQLGGLAVFWLSVVAFLLAAHQIQDMLWLQRLVWLFLALGALYVVGGLLPASRPTIDALFPHGATGSVFWIWLVSLAFGQAVFNRQLSGRWRWALGALVVAVFYAGLVRTRSWVSGWLPPLVSVVAILVVGRPRLGMLAALAAGLSGIVYRETIFRIIYLENEYSFLTRVEAWRIVFEIIKVNPVLGLGPANYRFYTPLFSILGWYVQFNSHNQYVDLVAQTGILGLASFLWFVWEVWRLGWRLRDRVCGGFAQAYIYGTLGAVGGMLAAGMLGDWVLPFVYNIGMEGMRASVLGWLFLGGLVVIEQAERTRVVV